MHVDDRRKNEVSQLAARITTHTLELLFQYAPEFFNTAKSENFCNRLQDVIRLEAIKFLDELEKHT